MFDLDPLTSLTITMSQPDLSTEDKYLAICKTVASIVDRADRVNLWQFDDEQSCIKCVMHYEKQSSCISKGQVLTRADFPTYFEAILANQWVIVNHAREHEDTQCFNEAYFVPNDIYSLLDFVFHDDTTPIGVICCEATGEPTTWSDADQTIIRRIASIIRTS